MVNRIYNVYPKALNYFKKTKFEFYHAIIEKCFLILSSEKFMLSRVGGREVEVDKLFDVSDFHHVENVS